MEAVLEDGTCSGRRQVAPLLKSLKFLSVIGGFPLTVSSCSSTSTGFKIAQSRVTLALALFILLVPGLTILTLLLTLSIRWLDFTENMSAAGFSFWDSLCVVSLKSFSKAAGFKKAY